jgi:hypothetical protein
MSGLGGTSAEPGKSFEETSLLSPIAVQDVITHKLKIMRSNSDSLLLNFWFFMYIIL